MTTEVLEIKWSTTGKRVDFVVNVYESGLFGRGDKLFSFKMFALGADKALSVYRGREQRLAEQVAENYTTWLASEGPRYYNYRHGQISVKIFKSKYQRYDG